MMKENVENERSNGDAWETKDGNKPRNKSNQSEPARSTERMNQANRKNGETKKVKENESKNKYKRRKRYGKAAGSRLTSRFGGLGLGSDTFGPQIGEANLKTRKGAETK